MLGSSVSIIESSMSSSPKTALALSTTAELPVTTTQMTTISDAISSSEALADGTTTTQAVQDTTTTAVETTSADGASTTTTEATSVSEDISTSVTPSDDITTLLASQMLGIQLALLANRVSVSIRLDAVDLLIVRRTWICVFFPAFVSAGRAYVPSMVKVCLTILFHVV
ncbi:hypothetical protein FMUND_10933 [Fusarium mundagurra]|uniref:Uncharacterized protein n=1 Tax=Fusarium mundagurra TaxID=1567541 RepID=A0A8H5Y8B7_9HYPO|nr:hypothetical protein FMUND_10933 [Fusarium mundagurra]